MAKTTPNTEISTAAAKTRKPRTAKKAAAPAGDSLQMNMLQSADDSLNALMAELGVAPDLATAPDEVVEPAVTAEEPAPAIAAMEELVTTAEPAGEVDPLQALMEQVGAAPELPAADKAVVEGDEAGEHEGEGEGGVEASAEPAKKAKREPKPRKFYSDQSERLRDNLGENLIGYTVLTAADAELDEEALKQVMDSTLATIRAMNKKEQKWAAKFIEFLAGKKSSLSEVTRRILMVLERDGHVSMGNEGNVFKDLLSKPYSPGAARAMGGNNLGMLKDLKVIIPGEAKGTYVGNPESLLLMKAKSLLAAAPAA